MLKQLYEIGQWTRFLSLSCGSLFLDRLKDLVKGIHLVCQSVHHLSDASRLWSEWCNLLVITPGPHSTRLPQHVQWCCPMLLFLPHIKLWSGVLPLTLPYNQWVRILTYVCLGAISLRPALDWWVTVAHKLDCFIILSIIAGNLVAVLSLADDVLKHLLHVITHVGLPIECNCFSMVGRHAQRYGD